MSGAAVLFYGRRSRSSSSRTFDDFSLSSSSSSSDLNINNSTTINNNINHHHRHHNHRLHHRHRHISFDDPPRSPPLPGSETHRGGNPDPPAQDINNRETVHGVSGRYVRNNRLPGSVLLAKERLVQRLRGVSVSGNRENRERLPSLPNDSLWVINADWKTNVLREEPVANTHITELSLGAPQQSSREPHMKPMGLTRDVLSQLHHEFFVEHKTPVTSPMSNKTIDCGICLESFAEGNKLINLPCGHTFHSSCLYPWLQTCGECPYCRSCITLT